MEGPLGNLPAPARSDAQGVHREWRNIGVTPAGAPGSPHRGTLKPPGSGQERCGNGKTGQSEAFMLGTPSRGPDSGDPSLRETKRALPRSDRHLVGYASPPRQT